MTNDRPKIAIPEIGQNLVAENYTRAVYVAGMDPVVVSFQAGQLRTGAQKEYVDYAQFCADNYDGLLLPGGADMNPLRYGEENVASMGVQDDLDELQLLLLDDFVRVKKPVLGICRGLQVVNVFFGGSLIQHLDTAARHRRTQDEQDNVHESVVQEGSWLAGLYGCRFFHNSAHHQAVKKTGAGLEIDSRSVEDEVVEAFHHRELPIYCVQWHPERMCLDRKRSDTVDGLPIFQLFCELCGGSGSSAHAVATAEIMDEMWGI